MKKSRVSMMIVLMLMTFLYIMDVVSLSEENNYAFSLALLIFSIGSVIDTYDEKNKLEEVIRFVLFTMALGIAIIFPTFKDLTIVQWLMQRVDTNVLLLLSIFFTLAGQWASEIKAQDKKGEIV